MKNVCNVLSSCTEKKRPIPTILFVRSPFQPPSTRNAQHRASPALVAVDAGICSFLVHKSCFLSEPDREENYTSQWAEKGKWGLENRASPPRCLRCRLSKGCAHHRRAQTPRQSQGGRERTSGTAGAVGRGGDARAVPLLPRGLRGKGEK